MAIEEYPIGGSEELVSYGYDAGLAELRRVEDLARHVSGCSDYDESERKNM